MKELICLIGPSGAGKSTAGHILEEKYRYTYFTASKYIKELQKDIEKTINYSYDMNELIAVISTEMPNGFNEYVAHLFLNCNSSKLVWDSCININHLDIVLRLFDKVHFLCLTAPYFQRINRIFQRGSFVDAPLDIVKDKVFHIDQYERTLGLGDLMIFSDWTITANSLPELDAKLAQFVEQCVPTMVEEKIKVCSESFRLPEKDNLIIAPFAQYLKVKGIQL